MLKVNDRVHWVGAPAEIGTVRRVEGSGDHQQAFVVWDNEQAGNNFFSRALRLA